jgi:hypothetical protein
VIKKIEGNKYSQFIKIGFLEKEVLLKTPWVWILYFAFTTFYKILISSFLLVTFVKKKPVNEC